MAIVREVQTFVSHKIEPEMHAVSSETGFGWEIVPGAAKALDTPAEHEVVQLAMRLAETRTLKRVVFGTEAGHFRKAGIATAICGPGHVDQAHKADEFLAMEQVVCCEAFMHSLMDEVCVG